MQLNLRKTCRISSLTTGVLALLFCLLVPLNELGFALQIQQVSSSRMVQHATGLVGKYSRFANQRSKSRFDKRLHVVNFGFGSTVNTNGVTSSLGPNLLSSVEEESVEAKVEEGPFCYPNPVRQDEGGEIVYRLSKNMDIELRIYNMRGQLMFKKMHNKGGNGGLKQPNWNKIPINVETFMFGGQGSDSHFLSAGVYFILLVHQDKVLGKGKMVVKP